MTEEIMKEYSFKHKNCYCGLELTGKNSVVVGLYRGVQPQGECPGCGRKMVLNTPPVEPKPSTRPKAVALKPRAKPELSLDTLSPETLAKPSKSTKQHKEVQA